MNIPKKNIHSAYAEATYQFTPRWIVNLGLKYDKVDIEVDYNVNRGGSKGNNTIKRLFPAQLESQMQSE